MSTNAVEKQAQKLNQFLRTEGKKQGKSWRIKVRSLLAQTFDALNAKPLNGALCLELSKRIEAELAALETGETTLTDDAETVQTKRGQPQETSGKKVVSADSCPQERIAKGDSPAEVRIAQSDSTGEGETRIDKVDSVAGESSPVPEKEISPEEIGLFDLIHIQIRCFFTLNACVRPPYIGKFVQYADRFAEITQSRIDKFINVLSKNEDGFTAKTEVEIGYNDDLLPDMPERGLVLHPKKKKKS